MTLGQAARELIYLVSCKDCKREARIDLGAMADRFGADSPLRKVKRTLKCGGCGSKGFIITTLWKSASTSDRVMRRWPMRGD